MATAIKTGKTDVLKAVLRTMGDAYVVAELISLSGEDLIKSSPLMHAVESGLDMVVVILAEMRAKLTHEQVCWCVLERLLCPVRVVCLSKNKRAFCQ